MAEMEAPPSKRQKISSTESKDISNNDQTEVSQKASESTRGPQNDQVDTDEPMPDAQAKVETSEGSSIPTETTKLSKNQLKKLRRKQEWEASRPDRKLKKKEKLKNKKARKAEERSANPEPPKPRAPPRRPTQLPISLVLDCGFDELMTEKEIISLGSQVARSYSENRKAPFRSHFAISSFNGQLRNRHETTLEGHYKNWKEVRFFDEDYVAAAKELHTVMRGPKGGELKGAFAAVKDAPAEPVSNGETGKATLPDETLQDTSAKKSPPPADTLVSPTPEEPSIVYLSSDSENTLDVLSPYTTYVIGGLVDKNRYKGICHQRASERGIPTAKLPIGEYMTMQSRSVLATNHVVEIMVKWLEYGDWEKAFVEVIPKRKEAKVKAKKTDGEADGANEEEEEENEGEAEQEAEQEGGDREEAEADEKKEHNGANDEE